jgi:hypothetical protein
MLPTLYFIGGALSRTGRQVRFSRPTDVRVCAPLVPIAAITKATVKNPVRRYAIGTSDPLVS